MIELIHGDALKVLPTLEAASVDLLLTDPPYGGGYAGDPVCGKNNVRGVDHKSQRWDDRPLETLAEVLKFGRYQVIWGGNYYSLPPSRGWLIWHKPDAPPSMASAELAWTNRDMNTRMLSHSIAATNRERVGHPTQKPVRLMSWCLSFFPDAMTVLDPFMGSGSTGVACVRAGLNFIGIESNAEYFAIAKRRIEQAQMQLMLALTG